MTRADEGEVTMARADPGSSLRFRRAVCLAGACVTFSCGNDPAVGFSTGPGVTSVSGSTSSGESTSASTGSGTSTSGAGASDGATGGSSTSGTFDMGTQPDFGPGQPEGCKGKIDLLFIIDRDGTMKTEQEQLLASLPDFIQTIEERFAGFDTHIMVTNPDGRWTGQYCEDIDWCGKLGNCGPNAPDYVCYTGYVPKPCDITLGAGLLFNAGPYATNYACELYGGNRYLIQGQPQFPTAFMCIAKVGTAGAFSRLGEAIVAAVSDELNGEGGCNEGFLRNDALLVITVITDAEDQSKTKPSAWYDAIVTAKGGDPNAVVMLAITPQPLMGEMQPFCTYNDSGKSTKLEDLIGMFPHHAEGDPCAAAYAPFFEEAAALVREACESYIPQ